MYQFLFLDTDDCLGADCGQHGNCQDRVDGYVCICAVGYSGVACESDIDYCNPDPCAHGLCSDGLSNYTCDCHDGYEGVTCGIGVYLINIVQHLVLKRPNCALQKIETRQISRLIRHINIKVGTTKMKIDHVNIKVDIFYPQV